MNNSTADYFIALSNKLAEENKVIVISSKIRETNISLKKNIIVLKWPSKRPTSWRDFWFLSKLVLSYKPNTMISMFSSVNLFLIVGWIFRVNVRVAWIRSLSTQFPQKIKYVYRKKIIYKLATQIITNSKATKKNAANFYSIRKNKIKVLPNSVIDYSDNIVNVRLDTSKIVYVGRLNQTKGVDVLIKAFGLLIKKGFDIHLDIIGNGNFYKVLFELTESLQLSDKVSFLGSKSKEDVLKAYKSSYCSVVPSYSEAFGFTVIESMSVGTCVIGANNTGIKEIIVNNKTGLLFETGNEIDLVEKFELIFNDIGLRNDLANAGYNRFLGLFENSYAINRDSNFLNKLKNQNDLYEFF